MESPKGPRSRTGSAGFMWGISARAGDPRSTGLGPRPPVSPAGRRERAFPCPDWAPELPLKINLTIHQRSHVEEEHSEARRPPTGWGRALGTGAGGGGCARVRVIRLLPEEREGRPPFVGGGRRQPRCVPL